MCRNNRNDDVIRFPPGLPQKWRPPSSTCHCRLRLSIRGYTRAAHAFDALIFGYYEGGQLVYVARTRNGFTPSSREWLFQHFKGLEISHCPFGNLPESRSGRWGQGLTAEKMEECVWLKSNGRPTITFGTPSSSRYVRIRIREISFESRSSEW